jgi:hypothetical protein
MFALGLPVRIGHVDLHEEPVELRLRQGIGAFLFDRVLRGEHVERRGQRPVFAGDRHLAFLHGLQAAPTASGGWRG